MYTDHCTGLIHVLQYTSVYLSIHSMYKGLLYLIIQDISCSVFEWVDISTKHLMTGSTGNSEFCFLVILKDTGKQNFLFLLGLVIKNSLMNNS